ncbi:double-stranded RNA-specific editase 1-like isoform X2 [Scylla paramamosain]|uniref:double-stranded RNA-specific editase 1-like isoform X2 n=1 Tax=Scylla paramamosain TaxID=85552 RepID=UPI003082C609
MKGRHRSCTFASILGCGGNWRTAVPEPAVDAFPADFYQNSSDMAGQDNHRNTDMHAPDMDMKMEGQESHVMVSDRDASVQEGERQAETRKCPWEKPGGIKVNRKKVPGAKNLKVRRYVQPKNAIVCLNELRPGVTYTMEQEGGVCQPFCISVEVDGQKYRGFGSSKQLAKQAAAEAALIGFLKPPVTTPENQEEDKTPWATLGPTGWLRKAFIPAMSELLSP